MLKRKIFGFFVFIMMMTYCTGGILAADALTPWASVSLSTIQANAYSASSPGEIEIVYKVAGKGAVTTCGVSSISIYEEDGTHVTTIHGALTNGLLVFGSSHMGSYFYDGESGVSYYAKVTFYASGTSGSDSRTVTTNVVRAP
jgi:hypothetical protein